VQEHATGVNVAHLQFDPFAQTEAAGIDGGQGDAMIQGGHALEEAAHLGGRENDGQFELGIGADQFHLGRPGAAEGFFPEEFEGAEGLGGGLPGDPLDGLEMNEVLAELLGADLIGRTIEMFTQLPDTGEIGLLGAGTDGQKLQVGGEGIEDCVRGGLFLCMVVLNQTLFCVVSGAARMPSGRRPGYRSEPRHETSEYIVCLRPGLWPWRSRSAPPRSGFVQPSHEASLAIDGDFGTFWHSAYDPVSEGFPHELVVELARAINLNGFTALPRQDEDSNGWIRNYEFYVSEDGANWGRPVAKGEFARNAELKSVMLSRPGPAKFVKLVALSGHAAGPWASLAELSVLSPDAK